jgi:hypothetical protein
MYGCNLPEYKEAIDRDSPLFFNVVKLLCVSSTKIQQNKHKINK